MSEEVHEWCLICLQWDVYAHVCIYYIFIWMYKSTLYTSIYIYKHVHMLYQHLNTYTHIHVLHIPLYMYTHAYALNKSEYICAHLCRNIIYIWRGHIHRKTYSMHIYVCAHVHLCLCVTRKCVSYTWLVRVIRIDLHIISVYHKYYVYIYTHTHVLCVCIYTINGVYTRFDACGGNFTIFRSMGSSSSWPRYKINIYDICIYDTNKEVWMIIW